MDSTNPSPACEPSFDFPTVHLRELYEIAKRRREAGQDSDLPEDAVNGSAPATAEEIVAWGERTASQTSASAASLDKQNVRRIRDRLVETIGPVGLALSGGGVRSASFCLGILQALSRESDDGKGKRDASLAQFDYLSTVSGGGYTGCMLSAMAARTDCERPASERRAEVLAEITRPAAPGRDQPFWQRLLFRGESLGQLFPFLARHIASTLIFNLTLLSGLVCVAALLALLWRELDRPPVHTFLSWASGDKVLEYNRPFLIPLAFFTAYICVALSRPECSWYMRVVGIGVPMAGFALWLGLPYFLILSPTLTIVCLILTLFSGNPPGTDRAGELRTEANGDAPSKRPPLLRGTLVVLPAAVAAFLWAYKSCQWHATIHSLFGWPWTGSVLCGGILIGLACGVILHLWGRVPNFALASFMGALAAAKGTVFGVLAAVIFHEDQAIEELRQYTYTALAVATGVLLVAELGLMFFIAAQIPRQTRRTLDQRMLMLTGLTAVVGFAVWVSTPNMRFASSIAAEDLWQGTQSWFNRVMAVVAALLLPFFRLQDVLRSGMQTKSTTARFLFNILSFGLLLGIPFVVVANLARHNLSGYAERKTRDVNDSDVNWELVFRRQLDSFNKPPAAADAAGLRGQARGGSAPPAPAAYDQILGNELRKVGVLKAEELHDPAELNQVEGKSDTTVPSITRRLREYGVAIPFGTRTWDSYYHGFDDNRQRAKACSDILHSPAFVWTVLSNPAAADYLLQTARKLQDVKDGGDRFDALKKKTGATLEPLLQTWRARTADPEYIRQFKPLVADNPASAEQPSAHLDRDVLDDLNTIGTLSFYVAYSDLPGTRPHGFVTRPVVIEEDQISRALILLLAATVFLLCLFSVDMNWTSALAFYRRQLQAMYLHRTAADAQLPAPNIHKLPAASIGLPYHLMNASVDFRSDNHEPALRSEPFVFSPLFCGGPNVGYRRTEKYKLYAVDRGSRDIDLADVIAISGAAVNPLRVENWLVRAILMVTNFRLHQWLPHPEATVPVRPNPINVLRSWPVLRPTQDSHVVPLVSVADGGFQDNLGVQALLARRCRIIVAVDAAADPDYLFTDLRRVLTWANLHGIRISFRRPDATPAGPLVGGVAPLLPRDRKPKEDPVEADPLADPGLLTRITGSDGRGVRFHERLADAHFVVADVKYPERSDGPAGKPNNAVLVYIKPTLTGDEPVELLTFRKSQPVFPNHPTVEQLFDPATVDAYRRLGLHIGEEFARTWDALEKSAQVPEPLPVPAVVANGHANGSQGGSPITLQSRLPSSTMGPMSEAGVSATMTVTPVASSEPAARTVATTTSTIVSPVATTGKLVMLPEDFDRRVEQIYALLGELLEAAGRPVELPSSQGNGGLSVDGSSHTEPQGPFAGNGHGDVLASEFDNGTATQNPEARSPGLTRQVEGIDAKIQQVGTMLKEVRDAVETAQATDGQARAEVRGQLTSLEERLHQIWEAFTEFANRPSRRGRGK
jgi:hypothetical protein